MKKAATTLASALFLVFNVFVFGPYTIYQGNIEEFGIPLGSILISLILPALVLLSVLCLIGSLLSEKARQFYVSILFALGLLVWLQGNFLVWKYGLFDGQGIDWSKNEWRGWADGALWAGLLILACLFSRKVYRIAVWGSAALMAILALSLLVTSLQAPETWAAKEKASQPLVPPGEIFEFSSQFNIIHIILDGYQSDIFAEVIAEDFGHYSKALEGFTFFKEAMGTFPTTLMSIPAFLSGQVYKNGIPARQFLDEVKRGKTIFNALFDRGYETFLVADPLFVTGARYSGHYQIAVPYGGTARKKARANSVLMVDLVLFRHAPHFLKKYVFNDHAWLIQRFFTPKNYALNPRYFSHAAFLDDMIGHLAVKRDKPVYKYIHLMTSHYPLVLNKDCEYAGKVRPTRDNIKIQARCVLNQIINFLDRLKEKGLYDSSLIILQSDHGQGHKISMTNMESPRDEENLFDNGDLPAIAGRALALMVIKPPQREDDFRISIAQVSLTDIPATISSLLNIDEKFEGRSVFDVHPDELRERRFYYYKGRNTSWIKTFFPRLDEFVVTGSVFDRNSWRKGVTYYPPGRAE
ncbi:MAG: sulfatase-like hydrolase/transferase [Candidatus Aminicenantales bacterium]